MYYKQPTRVAQTACQVPWIVPSEFYDTLPIQRWQDYPVASDPFAPIGMPAAAWHPPADVGGMHELPSFNGTVNMCMLHLKA